MKCNNQDFLVRISKINGQVDAIYRMYDEKRTAQEILQQIVAVRASLSSLAKLIVEAEVKGCLPATEDGRLLSPLVDTLFKVT